MSLNAWCRAIFSGNGLHAGRTALLASARPYAPRTVCPGQAAARFHGHAHHEPPHFAYRGDGLPPIACEQIQQMVHMNERMAQGKLASMRPSEAPLREAECNVEGHRIELYEDLKELHDTVMAANWHDSILLTMNADLWDGTLARLKRMAEDVSDMQVQIMLSKTLEIFDALYKVEDVQDHIFELIEELPHFGGKPATETPLAAGNIDKHIKHVLERYAQLKQEHPRYTAKIQDSVGYSLAILRQRYTFSWPEEHKYFY